MIIKYELIDELIEVVKKDYEIDNYSEVVKNALSLLNTWLKNRFKIDLDNEKLIDEIIKRDDAHFHLNNVYSELSEHIINGILLYLRGLYLKYKEFDEYEIERYSKDDVDVILANINYVLCRIDVSKKKFDLQDFLSIIGNSIYPNDTDYEDDLIDALPVKHRLEVMIKIINILDDDNYKDFSMFFYKLLKYLNKEEKDEVFGLISNKFLIYNTFEDLNIYLSIFPGEYFKELSEHVQKRIEDLMFDDFVKAKADFKRKEGLPGALAAKVTSFYLNRFDKKRWTDELVRKLNSDKLESDFAKDYLFYKMMILNHNETEESLLNYLGEKLEENDPFVVGFFDDIVYMKEDHQWSKLLKEKGKK